MTTQRRFLESGHLPTLIGALLYFDVSFMVWVLLLGGSFFRPLLGLAGDRLGGALGLLHLGSVWSAQWHEGAVKQSGILLSGYRPRLARAGGDLDNSQLPTPNSAQVGIWELGLESWELGVGRCSGLIDRVDATAVFTCVRPCTLSVQANTISAPCAAIRG